LHLGGFGVDLLLGEDAFFDEKSLVGGGPAFVIAKGPVKFRGQILLGAAMFVGGLDVSLVQDGVERVGETFPVLYLMLALVYRATGRAAEVVRAGHFF